MTDTARAREIAATVRGTEAELTVDGARRRLSGENVDAVREAVFTEVTTLAAEQGQPVRFSIVEGGTRWYLVIQPDGTRTTEFSEPVARSAGRRPIPNPAVPAPTPTAPEASPTPTASPAPAPVPPATPSDSVPRSPASPAGSPPAPPASQPSAPPTPGAGPEVQYGAAGRRPWPPEQPAARPAAASAAAAEPQPRHAVSFLPPEQPVELPVPAASQGFWGRLFGRKNEPDPALLAAQRAEAADQALVSKHWPGPKTIAVVNGKGGSGKTPTTALLAAVFARFGGGGVIAWDNNDTRGTLGWRTAAGGHDRTVLDLIPATEELMDRDAQVGRLAYYVHHQPEDKYDVLRSNPELLAREQRLSTEQFRALHAVCNRFYRLVFMDSGNDESTYAWLNMIEAADQIVVPTSTRPDHAEAAVLLLHALRNRNDQGRALADRAVVIVSQADQDEAAADTIAAGFRQLLPAENVVTIPYDRAIRDSQLRYDRLTPTTQRAFLRAAAAVAGQL